MCGIAGEIALTKFVPANLERSWPMINAILHRGPDDCHGWLESTNRAAFLHSRLSIVDLAHGRQPMHSSCGQITIVFNGEIYGFKRLRDDLTEGGYRFHSTSDTEVLLALYLRDGADFVAQLEGEFAFVIFDARDKTFLIARDRFGVKPLFYAIRDGLFLFGSEIKSLLAHPMIERRFDYEVLNRRIHGVLLPDETMFAGVKSVLPGSMMLIGAAGDIVTRRHAILDPQLAGRSHLDPASAQDAFEEAFSSAVRDRLHGDVDVGVYLSGGVDSNLLGAVMRENSSANHTAFTIGFNEAGYGEAEDAAFAARKFGFAHDIEPVGEGDLDHHFARSIWHNESNVVNTHGTAKLCLSGRASKRVKVILSGEGADEIHGGYAYYRHAQLLCAVQDKAGRRAMKEFLADNGPEDGVLTLASAAKRNRLAGASNAGIPYAAQRAAIFEDLMKNMLNRDFAASTMSNPAGQLLDWIDLNHPGARRLDDMSLSRYTSAVTEMSIYNLSFLGDRSEMANSIEGRLPFLDKRVVDLLWSLPAQYHIGDQSKTLIRGALAKRMPPRVANRYKRIFVAPSSASKGLFDGEQARHWLSPDAVRAAGVFRPISVQAMRRLHSVLPQRSSFRKVVESFLMTVLSVHILDDLFIKNFDASLETYACPHRPTSARPHYLHLAQRQY